MTLLKTAGTITAAILFVVALFFLQQRTPDRGGWSTASALIEDSRPRLVSQVQSQFGGAMLYQPEVFVKYEANGTIQERWITLSQQPAKLADVQFELWKLKGTTCIVRWKPPQSNIVFAETSY